MFNALYLNYGHLVYTTPACNAKEPLNVNLFSIVKDESKREQLFELFKRLFPLNVEATQNDTTQCSITSRRITLIQSKPTRFEFHPELVVPKKVEFIIQDSGRLDFENPQCAPYNEYLYGCVSFRAWKGLDFIKDKFHIAKEAVSGPNSEIFELYLDSLV